MRFEFSWQKSDGEQKTFRTDDPQRAEDMMRGCSDYPKITDEMRNQFDALFPEHGSFVAFLSDIRVDSGSKRVQIDISGLSLVAVQTAGSITSLLDRPNSY